MVRIAIHGGAKLIAKLEICSKLCEMMESNGKKKKTYSHSCKPHREQAQEIGVMTKSPPLFITEIKTGYIWAQEGSKWLNEYYFLLLGQFQIEFSDFPGIYLNIVGMG